jgi:hypothetical protein
VNCVPIFCLAAAVLASFPAISFPSRPPCHDIPWKLIELFFFLFLFYLINLTRCPKSWLTQTVRYFPIIIFACLQILIAAVGNIVVTLALVSLGCCVIGVLTEFVSWL